ncbi:hypothetical protein TTHERM_00194160 (macronuclear) [Tetrahymena thermophila SB210]|uniref:Kinase domain protein n=1 Tax=Tetrahymena thermophila (strain SB210) TaxID=312017 RepID=Q23KB9_TETTS|nr:hypothetical protein TTHERM_00194160 [Tetrahymena thermophila SB210]EAR96924.1 hypothetical protein TTHERM_00194160 [Tetrahymena thermophila SB210]|eukprot:XP_001017169.1 hypothetical protein TTHERM_00194160 [Tetrahymena thermophila SB210]
MATRSNNSVGPMIEALKGQTRINLADQYIGNEGSRILANFLMQNQQVQVLELKGNNIGVDGLIDIIEALRSNDVIKILSLEWNNIGQDIRGLESLGAFLLQNKSLQHLSLAQNKIVGDDIEMIANALRNNKTLLSLDLRWNQLGPRGANLLKSAIMNNQTLIYLDIGGNNINEDLQDALDKIILENRRKNPLTRDRILGGPSVQAGDQNIQQQQQQNNPQFTQSGFKFQAPQQDKEGLPMLAHLENILEQEKAHTFQIKQRLEVELEELQRKDRNDLRTIQELESKCNDVQNQNRMLKFDIDRLREEFQIIERNNIEHIRTHEERIRNNEFIINEMEKKHATNTDRILQENNFRVKEMARDWESRCRLLEERVRLVENEGIELETELKKISDKKIEMQIKQEEELRDLASRVEEEEYNKAQSNLSTLEAKLKAIENSKELLIKRNHELIREYEERDIKASNELRVLEEELQNLKAQNQEFTQKNSEFKILSEKLKNDLDLKDTIVEKLQKEINTVNEQIEMKKQFAREQIEKTIKEQREEKLHWDAERDAQIRHIQELERALRASHTENSRLRGEYQRLAETVQSNLNKAVYDTFTTNKYF